MKFLTLILISMYALSCKVTIGNVSFQSVNELVIDYSIHRLVQKAVIRVPLSARLNNAGQVTIVESSKVFKKGDAVSIELGYDGRLFPEFNGYVTGIVYGTPLTIECEDAMYIVRKNHITLSKKEIKLKEVIDLCLKGLYKPEAEIPEMTINNFAVKDEPATNILQNLRNDYGLGIFFTPRATLYCGLLYGYKEKDVKYNFHRNIIPGQNALKYQDEDEVKIKVIAKSWKKGGGLIEAEAGDKDGQVRTLWFYDIQDKEALKKRAEAEIIKYKYSGYTGHFYTLLEPYAEIGMKAIITDPDFEDRGGSYYIESVEVRYGMQGARRKIEPGIKL